MLTWLADLSHVAGVFNLFRYLTFRTLGAATTGLLLVFFFGVIEVPALVMLGLWFAEQAVFGAAGLTTPAGDGGGVAYFAHIGGFIFGLLAIRVLATRRTPTPPTAAAYR